MLGGETCEKRRNIINKELYITNMFVSQNVTKEKNILETIISVKTFREDAKHATFLGLISPKLITLSVSIGHCPLKGFVKQRCTALERAMARGPRFFSGCFVSFLLFFFPSSVRFARPFARSLARSLFSTLAFDRLARNF